ncbi:MAG: 50S ribosomal protein L30e [Halobacteriota archaeon]
MQTDIAKSLRAAIRNGKVAIGAKETLKAINSGEAQLIILASNCPERFKRTIRQSNIRTVELEFSSIELGSLSGKPFTISSLSVIDSGPSDIMELREKEISDDRS